MANDRILVVDDEETIREIVSSMLGGAHFQTRQAASGVEALAILESGEEFDLVLSDLNTASVAQRWIFAWSMAARSANTDTT